MNRRFLAILAFGPALAGCQSPASTNTSTTAADTPPLAGAAIGGPFALTDAKGRTVTDRSFAGQWRIMYFGYSFCPDVCPTDAQAIGAGLRRFAERDPYRAARVVPIFVTIDPARDTPAVLGRFVAAFHPRMVGLSGSTDAVARAEKAFAVYARRGETTPGGGYMMDHSRQTYLMDPDNKPVALIPADEGPTAVADALARWVK
ncbi:SCO family protein [Sphingomonas abaci]|uniref:Protein SCO1/2 n=1 Tax=Sphingomonas abaci TaxID=237611 RepID=A0A7W7F0G4_9SPHN|nr:SCO family protein [Sphingomonas abaci]MBB4618320.1 protein SCO1/2 [Sphingomonas abaci]